MRPIRVLVEELELIDEETDGRKSTCILIPLPEDLAKEFPPAPNKYGEDPHISVLFVGPQSEDEFEKTVEAVRGLVGGWSPFHVDLAGYGEFENRAGELIPHAIPYADEIPMLHNALWATLEKGGLSVSHVPGPFRPHATLAYVKKGEKYDGPRPKGRFTVNGVKISGHRPETAMFRRPAESAAGNPLTKTLSEKEWEGLKSSYARSNGPRLRLRERSIKPHPKTVWECAECFSKFESDGVDRGYQFLGERPTGFCDGPADEAFCVSCFKLREERVAGRPRYITRAEVMAFAQEAMKLPRFQHEKRLRDMAEGLAGYGLSRANVLVMDFREDCQAQAFMEKARQAGYSVTAGDTARTVHVRHPELVGEQARGISGHVDRFPPGTIPGEPLGDSPNTAMADIEESRPRLKLRRK